MNRKLTTKTILVFLPCSSIRQLDCRGVGLQKESNQCICSRPNRTEQREQMGRAYGRSYEAPWSTEELCHRFLRRVARRCMELALGFHRPLPAPRAVDTKVVHTKILPHFKYPSRLTTPGSCRPDNGILSLFFCKTFNGVCHEATVDIVSCIFHRTYFNSVRSIYPYFSTPNLFFSGPCVRNSNFREATNTLWHSPSKKEQWCPTARLCNGRVAVAAFFFPGPPVFDDVCFDALIYEKYSIPIFYSEHTLKCTPLCTSVPF